MIIEVKKIKEVEFRALDYGEVFEYCEDIYIVMPTITADGEEIFNAVELSSGYAEHFCADIKVIPHPKAKLIIED